MPDAANPAPSSRIGLRGVVLVLSLFANLGLVAALVLALTRPTEPTDSLTERHYSGDTGAADKVAVIRIAGVLMDGNTGFAQRQIEQAARDRSVKAIVVRIESPGGTISASEELYRALTDLRDNTNKRYVGSGPKPLVASMGNIAASGGYYIAMPAGQVYAEPTTITGSIGVFAALPNISELANKNGIKVEMVKAGDIKGGGSPFHSFTPEDRQPWQDMVDHAYDRFLTVVATGRPMLSKERLVKDKIERTVRRYDARGLPQTDEKGQPVFAKSTRYRADGGSFTPPQALELQLIDTIGDLHAAAEAAAKAAQLSRYRIVTYERPKGLLEQVLALEAKSRDHALSAETVGSALTPRLWYLTPSFELATVATTATQP